MIPTIQERFVSRSTNTQIKTECSRYYQLLLCGIIFNVHSHLLPAALAPASSYLLAGFARSAIRMLFIERDREKIGSFNQGGLWGMACSFLSCLVCFGRDGHSATLGLSGLTDHINTHTQSLLSLVSRTAACCHSAVKSIAICGWSHINCKET